MYVLYHVEGGLATYTHGISRRKPNNYYLRNLSKWIVEQRLGGLLRGKCRLKLLQKEIVASSDLLHLKGRQLIQLLCNFAEKLFTIHKGFFPLFDVSLQDMGDNISPQLTVPF